MSAPAPLVLFDLDGTLVDSAVDLHAAMCALADGEGREAPPLERFRRVVSKGARAMLALTYPDLDEAAREARLQPFLDHYAGTVEDSPRAYAGIPEVLDWIEASGSRWGIVTNKPEALARRVVACMGWSTRTAILVGGDTLPVKKPDPGTLLHACRVLGFEPATTVYVGDDERDVLAARAAGMPCVAVTWGYREAHESPADWGAERLADHPGELVSAGLLAAVRVEA